MSYRTRINYTAQQKSEMWDRWQRGESLNAIGRALSQKCGIAGNVANHSMPLVEPLIDRHPPSLVNSPRQVVYAQSHENVHT